MTEVTPAASGAQRAAILLMALGEEYAAEIMKLMDPRELHKLGAAMAGLKNVDRTQVSEALAVFNDQADNQTSMGVNSQDYIRGVLVRALGRDKAKSVMDSIMSGSDPASSGMEVLRWVDAEAIAGGLREEHPQVVALVLSCLEPQQSAQVAKQLPEALRLEAVARVASLETIPSNALVELNEVIEQQVLGRMSQSGSAKVGGAKRAAEILNLLDSSIEGAILDHLKQQDSALGQEVEELMVVFDSLVDVQDRGIQTLLREVSSETLMVALRGADDRVREKILNNMSKRAAEMLRDDLEVMPPVRLSDVENAQREIMTVAKRLADAGEISLGSKGGDDYV